MTDMTITFICINCNTEVTETMNRLVAEVVLAIGGACKCCNPL